MRNIMSRLAILIIFISMFLFNACSTDKNFVKKDMSTLAPIKVVRYETPSILRSNTTETFLITTAAIVLPGGSALLLLNDEYCKERGKDMQTKIPDFGYLVMKKFDEKLVKERSDCPPLTTETNPVKEDFTDSSTLIEIDVKRLAYGYIDFLHGGGNGFLSKTTVTMKDPLGEILWQKSFTYVSKDYDRQKDIDELEANGGNNLKTEMEFAAEKTASDFIEHLNSNRPEEKVCKENTLEKVKSF
jgi:hypothetical protein